MAGRDKDMAAIKAVVENFPNLDRQRLEQWVRAFADAVDSPRSMDSPHRVATAAVIRKDIIC